jgi:hypothetical protein
LAGPPNSRPLASVNVNPNLAVPIPLISPLDKARGHDNQGAETASGPTALPASKMENLIDDDPLLTTRMCNPPPSHFVRHIHATPVVSLAGKFNRMSLCLLDRVAEVEKGVVGLGETDEALARVFDL